MAIDFDLAAGGAWPKRIRLSLLNLTDFMTYELYLSVGYSSDTFNPGDQSSRRNAGRANTNDHLTLWR
jgi:hypothetical protein